MKYAWLLTGIRKLPPGEAFLANKGSEFDCAPGSFRGAVYRAAAEKGRGWKATTIVHGRTVVYAFYQNRDYMRPNLPAYPIVKKIRGEE